MAYHAESCGDSWEIAYSSARGSGTKADCGPHPRVAESGRSRRSGHVQRAVEFPEFPGSVRSDADADEGKVHYEWKGRRRKVHINRLVQFKAWLGAQAQLDAAS